MFPLPYILLAALLGMAASFGVGWHYGTKAEKTALATYKVEIAAAEAEWRSKVGTADARADKAEAALKAARAKKRQVIIDTVVNHAQTLPDPPECALDSERVSVINAAIEAANRSDLGSEAATVSTTAPAKGGITLTGGVLGSGNGNSLRRMFGIPAKSD